MVISGVVAIILLTSSVFAVVVFARDSDRAGGLVQIATTMLPMTMVAVTWLLARRHPPPAEPDRALAAAADALAGCVHRQWRIAASERGLWKPLPVQVRWRWSERAVTGPVEAAIGDHQAHTRFAPLPGMPLVDAKAVRAGGLKDLAGVYGGIRSGRVVILGAPGTGKSAAAILALLDVLAHRDSLNEAQRAEVPVPVLLTAHDWDPHHHRLDE